MRSAVGNTFVSFMNIRSSVGLVSRIRFEERHILSDHHTYYVLSLEIAIQILLAHQYLSFRAGIPIPLLPNWTFVLHSAALTLYITLPRYTPHIGL